MDPLNSFYNFLASPVLKIFFITFELFVVAIWFALAGWTYRDAGRRGASAVYWTAVVLFFNIFGWFIYLILRPPEYLEETRERELEIKTKQAELRNSLLNCPACHKLVERDFLICPHCRKKLKNPCSNCSKPLNLSWTICPFCKTPV